MLAMRNPLDRAAVVANGVRLSEFTGENRGEARQVSTASEAPAKIQQATAQALPAEPQEVRMVRYEVIIIRGGVIEHVMVPAEN